MKYLGKGLVVSVIALMAMAAMFVSSGQQAEAGTITFDGLVGHDGDAFRQYDEAGFHVMANDGCKQAQMFGDPTPSIVFDGPGIGAIVIDGPTFTFVSVDIAANDGDLFYEVHGIKPLGGMYTFSGIVPGRSGPSYGFDTIVNPFSAVPTRELFVLGTKSGSSFNIDNIVVFATGPAVPLPSAAWSGLALLGGLGLVSVLRRHKPLLAA